MMDDIRKKIAEHEAKMRGEAPDLGPGPITVEYIGFAEGSVLYRVPSGASIPFGNNDQDRTHDLSPEDAAHMLQFAEFRVVPKAVPPQPKPERTITGAEVVARYKRRKREGSLITLAKIAEEFGFNASYIRQCNAEMEKGKKQGGRARKSAAKKPKNET